MQPFTTCNAETQQVLISNGGRIESDGAHFPSFTEIRRFDNRTEYRVPGCFGAFVYYHGTKALEYRRDTRDFSAIFDF